MTNQALLPKKGLNILDSMFNQLWEYGEKGPTLEMPSWCREAIDSINQFEQSMLDAWTEVFDCWEREFITRLWRIEVEHHSTNWLRQQLQPVQTVHDHTHPIIGVDLPSGGEVHVHPIVLTSLPSPGGDSFNFDVTPMDGVLICPTHLADLLKPVCVCYRELAINPLAITYRPDVKELCQWMVAAVQAIGIKQAAISAVMNDPSLNGNCCNSVNLKKINDLRTKNHEILAKIEHAYGVYMDVDNMKNKKEYDEEVALAELQANKYSNEDQLNMGSSLQSESKENDLTGELCQGGIDIKELKPWNHLNLSENKVEPKPIPAKCVCNKFDKVVKSLSNFESAMNIE